MKKFGQPLKVAGLVLTVVGFLVAEASQRREIDEAVDEAVEKRFADGRTPYLNVPSS